METPDLFKIVAGLNEQDARGPITEDAPGDPRPLSIPLCWTDWIVGMDDSRLKALAKLCRLRPECHLLCTMCKEMGDLRCSACGARYCSQKCRKDDWGRHKIICKLFAKWDYASRPSENHFLAIVLPAKEKEPQLVWYELTIERTKFRVTHPDIHRLRARDPLGYAIQIISGVYVRRMFFGHGLAVLDVYGLQDVDKDGLLNINKCLNSLALPGSLLFYSGPHVLFAFEGDDDGEPARGYDVSPTDWRFYMDYLLYNLKNSYIAERPPGELPVQTATKINHASSPIMSQIYGIRNPTEGVVAPLAHWPESGPCSLAFQIGLPWKVRYVMRCEAGPPPDHMKYLKPYLHRLERKGAPNREYEWVTMSPNRCGSLVVVSASQRSELNPHYIHAFNKYMGSTLEKGIVPSRKGFMDYWDKYAAVHWKSESLGWVPNPYYKLPGLPELVEAPNEDYRYRKALLNLMGHFASKDFKVEVEEEIETDGAGTDKVRLVPARIVAPYDVQGEFKWTEEHRKFPGGAFPILGMNGKKRKDDESASEKK